MYRFGFRILMPIFFLLTSHVVFAQNIYDPAGETNTGTSDPNAAGMPAKEFKASVTANAKKVNDALMQELQQQLTVYRAMNPIPSNLNLPSGTTNIPPTGTTATTPTPPTPAPPTSVINAPSTPSQPATYTGFGTQQTQPAKPAPSPSGSKPTSPQWNIRY